MHQHEREREREPKRGQRRPYTRCILTTMSLWLWLSLLLSLTHLPPSFALCRCSDPSRIYPSCVVVVVVVVVVVLRETNGW